MKGKSSISFAICTYGDSISLVKECLNSIFSNLGSTAEAIVVHEADDSTFSYMQDSIETFQHNTKLIRQVGDRGLSNGRNIALDNCETEWLAFLDDDAQMIGGWGEAFFEGLKEYPNSVGFTGPIIPSYEAGNRQYPQSMEWLVSCNTRKLTKGPVRNGFGANMVFNAKKISENKIRFRSEFGWVNGMKGDAISGEETIFSSELTTSSGCPIIWLPDLSVLHKVPKSRTRIQYVWKRSFKEGKTKSILSRSDLAFSMGKERGHLLRIMFLDIPAELIRLPLGPIRRLRNLFGIATMVIGTLSGFLLYSVGLGKK